MTLQGPPDSAFVRGGSIANPFGSAFKRAKVMSTVSTDTDTTAPYPEYGGKASNSRIYDHGETTSFVPITTVVALGRMTEYTKNGIMRVGSQISAGTVLDAKHVMLDPVSGRGKEKAMSTCEMPLPLVSDALVHKHNGVDRATFTVAVEGRAVINKEHLGSDCASWAQGDRLVWQPPDNGGLSPTMTPWTLIRAKTTSQTHAIVFNEYVGTIDSGYILVFIVGLP